MPIRIFTVPFNEATQTFHDDLVQQFCVNKRVHKIETRFFTKNGHPFWTVAVHYGVILENEERMARQMEKVKDTEFGLDDAQKALLVRLRACSGFGFVAKASKFSFNEGKICSRSRAPTAKILTNSERKFAAWSPNLKSRTRSKRIPAAAGRGKRIPGVPDRYQCPIGQYGAK